MDFYLAALAGTFRLLNMIGCNEDSGSGFYPAINLSGTPGETMFIQLWDVGANQATAFEICASGSPTCTSPAALYTRECIGNNQYQINMNITHMGDATEL